MVASLSSHQSLRSLLQGQANCARASEPSRRPAMFSSSSHGPALRAEYVQAEPEDPEVRQQVPLGGAFDDGRKICGSMLHDDVEYICEACGDALTSADDFVILRRNKVTQEVDRWVCRPCNNLRARIARLRKGQPAVFNGWETLTDEQRRDLHKKLHRTFGSSLAKHISEEIKNSTKKTNTSKHTELGKYYLVDDAKELPRFKRNPQALEMLMARAPKFTCALTGEVHVYVPEYTFSREDTETNEEEKTRILSGEAKVSNPKGVKEAPVKLGEKPFKLPKGASEKGAGAQPPPSTRAKLILQCDGISDRDVIVE